MTRSTVCLLFCLVGTVRAQPADTLQRPETTAPHVVEQVLVDVGFVSPDSTPVPGALGLALEEWSALTAPRVLPVVAPSVEVTDILARTPGSFLYDLGPPGWPHGWSPDGLDPATVGLSALEVSWNDPLTGRPRFDLLPFEFFEPMQIGAGRYGEPVAVTARLRSFDAPRPVTELRYRRGPAALQAIAATHAQRRRVRILGAEGILRATGGYGGRASEGEYPGSRLRRERRVLARVVFAPANWHVDLLNLHSRHQVGAHGGVLPQPGQGLASVYDRFGARVENPNATRRTVRNDLIVEVGLPFSLAERRPLLRAFWTAQTFRFRDPADTLRMESDRMGIHAMQELAIGPVSPWLDLRIETERVAMSWHSDEPRRTELHAAMRDTIEQGPLRLVLHTGIRRTTEWSASVATAGQVALGPLTLFLHASHGPNPSALLSEYGLGDRLQPAEEPFRSQTSALRGGVRLRRNAVDLGLTGFVHRTSASLLFTPLDVDSAVVRAADQALGRMGVTAELGLRAYALRGFYLQLEGTASTGTGGAEGLSARMDAALPALFGRGRGGMRYRLFRGDLDLNVFAEVRAWSRFESRTLHSPTGLLILPVSAQPTLGPSSTLSLFVEAGVRDATVFLAWENVLAGTDVLPGTMLVPVYPLPEQAFRFGVYWPIWD